MMRDERGALAIWTSIALLAFMITIGLGVDFVGHARAEQEARAVAAEAARAGGQQITIASGRATPVAGSAVAEARRFASAAGYTSSASVTGTRVTVHVEGTYETSFLGVIGVWELGVAGSGTSDVFSVVDGAPR